MHSIHSTIKILIHDILFSSDCITLGISDLGEMMMTVGTALESVDMGEKAIAISSLAVLSPFGVDFPGDFPDTFLS